MRGRKPKPTLLHKVEGTFHATRHGRGRAGEPVAQGDISEAPEWMTDAQRASWAYAIAHAPPNILRTIDAGVLAVWIAAEDQHRMALMEQAKLDAKTTLRMLVKDKSGQAVASPYLGISHRAGLRMIKAASELGFSPAARPRLANGTREEEAESPWAQFRVFDGGKA